MKNSLYIVLLAVFTLISCHTRVVSASEPMQRNSLDLYQKYTFQLNDARIIKMEVLKVDEQNVYGKSKDGTDIVISKTDIREVKKVDFLSSVAVGLAAVAAVIFVPI